MSALTLQATVSGAESLVRTLRATPREIERAQRNAINAEASAAKRRAVARIAQATGVPAKLIRQRLAVQRASRRRAFAVVRALGKRVPLKHWRLRVEPAGHPTRARVSAQTGLDGRYRRVYAFVNPQGRARVPLARYPRGARSREALDDGRLVVELRSRALLVIGGRGASVRLAMRQWITPLTQRDVARRLALAFDEKLAAQLARRAVRARAA